MRVLTIEECDAWLAERSIAMVRAGRPGSDHQIRVPAAFPSEWASTPQDARTVASLAHRLAGAFPCDGSLLVVTVVTSFQEHELESFLYLRRSCGETRWVDGVPGGATPGHLFDEGPRHNARDVREMLGLLMAYNFEGSLISADGSIVVGIHDDVVEWRCKDRAELQTFRATASLLGLEQTDWGRELMARRRRLAVD
jgi:hypothetical protein